jgi:hypothetical protein
MTHKNTVKSAQIHSIQGLRGGYFRFSDHLNAAVRQSFTGSIDLKPFTPWDKLTVI